MRNVDWNEVTLLGVDVGYSKMRPSTGVAWMRSSGVGVTKTHSDESRRLQAMPKDFIADEIAIDGPLAPKQHSLKRDVEYRFIRGAFQKRCKPGLSHFGSGLQLRVAANEAAETYKRYCNTSGPGRACRIVEAFPNAFLGVMVPDSIYLGLPKLKRGAKFDWLYDRALEEGCFHKLLSGLGITRLDLLERCLTERHHEHRAALVCVLTAACSLAGVAKKVGDEAGGWFWLPPDDLWQPWARDALNAR